MEAADSGRAGAAGRGGQLRGVSAPLRRRALRLLALSRRRSRRAQRRRPLLPAGGRRRGEHPPEAVTVSTVPHRAGPAPRSVDGARSPPPGKSSRSPLPLDPSLRSPLFAGCRKSARGRSQQSRGVLLAVHAEQLLQRCPPPNRSKIALAVGRAALFQFPEAIFQSFFGQCRGRQSFRSLNVLPYLSLLFAYLPRNVVKMSFEKVL